MRDSENEADRKNLSVMLVSLFRSNPVTETGFLKEAFPHIIC